MKAFFELFLYSPAGKNQHSGNDDQTGESCYQAGPELVGKAAHIEKDGQQTEKKYSQQTAGVFQETFFASYCQQNKQQACCYRQKWNDIGARPLIETAAQVDDQQKKGRSQNGKENFSSRSNMWRGEQGT